MGATRLFSHLLCALSQAVDQVVLQPKRITHPSPASWLLAEQCIFVLLARLLLTL